ncbi:MAG: hypothetical protein J4431_04020 [Candidatus Aenigmarchaeota archaeon]|nr:hypothetical protein [Candidatus Aenigmarchaeota archaeon]
MKSEKIARQEIERLFASDNYISLRSLDKPVQMPMENIISLQGIAEPMMPEIEISLNPLGMLSNESDTQGVVMKILQNRCEHLSPGVECNVGGFGSLQCLDGPFHRQCPFKQRHAYLNSRKTEKA